jgi:diacylglycerol O-acyltransferase
MSGASDRRLTAFDKLLQRGERDPRTRSSGVGIDLLDVVPEWEAFVAAYDRASRTAVRLRERIVSPSIPVTAPRWIIDPDFDLRYHLRRVRLPGDGSHRELLDLAEQIAMTPLDESRPLWTVTLVEGLDGGGAAVVTSMSHVISDGLGMVAMFAALYDTQRAARQGEMPLVPVPQDLDSRELTIDGIRGLPGAALGLTWDVLGKGLSGLVRPVATVTNAASYAGSLNRVVASFSATEPSPLLARRGASRRMVTHDLDFARLRGAAKALGGSVNDAYLAAVCATMRRYHAALGLPIDRLPMAIPVSLRSKGDADGGNHWTGMAIGAPIAETQPAAIIADVHAQVAAGRAEPAADVMNVLSNVTAALPDALYAEIAGLVRPADVQASNVPSYPVDTYLAGAKVMATYAMGPVPGIAVMIVMLTRAGKAFLGVRYDTDSIRDDELFERCLVEGFEEVLSAGGQPAAAVPVKTGPGAHSERLGAGRAKSPAPTRKRSAATKNPATPKTAVPTKTTAPTKTASPRKTTAKATKAAPARRRTGGTA